MKLKCEAKNIVRSNYSHKNNRTYSLQVVDVWGIGRHPKELLMFVNDDSQYALEPGHYFLDLEKLLKVDDFGRLEASRLSRSHFVKASEAPPKAVPAQVKKG